MPIVLLRVDERLIHGQVVVGWGNALDPDRIVVVDDEVAANQWEQDLYRLGVPNRVEAEFTDVDGARRGLPGWRSGSTRTIVLVKDVATLSRLAEDGALAGSEVNLGGVHHAEGRSKALPYLFLSGEEKGDLRAVAESGVEISARDLPNSRPVSLEELLKDGS
ncbi:MAG: PTS system mannose/fructose/N-acetylgalactosamine-transporter subunit IIB [Longimicrobiaceae bacterium]